MSPTQKARNPFGDVGRYLVQARGDVALAYALAERAGAHDMTKMVLRGNVPASGVADVWSAADAPYKALEQAFLTAQLSAGAFGRIAADAIPLPARTRLGVAVGVAEASPCDEGFPVPLQAPQLQDLGPGLVPQKVSALVVMTTMLAQVASTSAVIERELRAGLTLASDRALLTAMCAVGSPITSVDLPTDIEAMLDQITTTAQSKLHFVFSARAIKSLLMRQSLDSTRYPGVTIDGGEIASIPVSVSDGLPAGTALLIDAQSLAVDTGDVGLSASTQFAAELHSAPMTQDSTHSTPADLISAYQSSLVGLLAQRTFAFQLMRDASVASIADASY